MKVNDRIRRLRELKNWSQEDMAEQMQMSKNGYSKLERGESRLSLDRLEQVAAVFKMDVLELMTVNDKGLVYQVNENSNHNSASYFDSEQAVAAENEKLRLMLQHRDEMLAQKDSEIQVLKDLVAALKPAD